MGGSIKVEPAADPTEEAPLASKHISRPSFKVTPKQPPLALWALLRTPADSAVILPKRYFAASNELVVLTLLVCWCITLAYDYKLVWDHPARRYVGHFNPCFGWDYPPASYIAVFACAADVYLAWTYATLEGMRTRLRDDDGMLSWAERFSLVTTYLHGLASMLWLLLWVGGVALACTTSVSFAVRAHVRARAPSWQVVGPPDNRWVWHLAIFSCAVFFRYLCTLGNYVEQRFGKAYQMGRVHKRHTYFIVFYGAVTVLLPIMYFTDVIVYKVQKRSGVDPPIPWQAHASGLPHLLHVLHVQFRLPPTQPPPERIAGTCCRPLTLCGWALWRRPIGSPYLSHPSLSDAQSSNSTTSSIRATSRRRSGGRWKSWATPQCSEKPATT